MKLAITSFWISGCLFIEAILFIADKNILNAALALSTSIVVFGVGLMRVKK